MYRDKRIKCTEIAGVSTFASPLDINGSIDVDGHTELDNTNIVGILTVTNVASGDWIKLLMLQVNICAGGGGGEVLLLVH